MKSTNEYRKAIELLTAMEKSIDELTSIEEPLYREYLKAEKQRRLEIIETIKPILDKVTVIRKKSEALQLYMFDRDTPQ